MTETLTTYRIGKWGLEPDVYDPHDVQGQLLVWEPPFEWADYVAGADPTMGILGWSRSTRTDEDHKHDNAALEVLRVGSIKDGIKQPDVQVAEWVGPIDAEDFAYVCNFVGRLYAGSSEEKQALMCIEVYPGPGWLTQRVLHDQYGYERFPDWLVEGKNLQQKITGRKGWISNQHTRRDLWTRSGGHIKRRKVRIHSKFLVEEMVACTPDNFIAMTARAARLGRSGLNDDRVVALLIAEWFANEWTIGQEASEPTAVVDEGKPDWQHSAMSYEDMIEAWNQRVAELQD